MGDVAGLTMTRAVRVSSLLFSVATALAVTAFILGTVAYDQFTAESPNYIRLSILPQFKSEEAVEDLRGALIYILVAYGAAFVLAAILTLLVRRPRPWVRPVAWVAAPLAALLVFLALMGALESAGLNPDSEDHEQMLFAALVPDWFTQVNAVVGGCLLAALIAALIAATRSSSTDFYRPASKVEDPRWAAFVARQQEAIEQGTDNEPRST